MGAPTGNVTLVFTDIEGSTVLWERYGDAFKSTLDAHNAAIRQALADHNGYEVKTEGDAFFVVFAKPVEAALFSLDVQRAMLSLKLKAEDSVRVRIGVHSGEPLVEFDAQGKADYFGPAVNRAARISAAGHGGQTLISGAMAEPLREILADKCEFLDLGEHRLRGLDEPQQLVQLVIPEAPVKRFGPLRALSETPTNLPAQTTTFLGRDKELRQLKAMLLGDEARRTDPVGPLDSLARQPGVPDTNQVTRDVLSKNRGSRLITLTGPGGCGKTRLALALAAGCIQDFPGGVWVADLGDAREENDLCRAVMEALGNQLRPGKATPAQQVAWALENSRALLVLDTFEHLSKYSGTLSLWLRSAPRLKMLVTSRELLRVEGEAEFPVAPLAAPAVEHVGSSTERLSTRISGYPAVQLFLERASQAMPGFVLTPQNAGAVAEICHRLDGMPLAIELAAARLNVLSPQQLAQRLEKGFDLISSRSRDKKSTRQTNLRNTIEWSYSLLDVWERAAFLQLSWFAGPFTLESAEAVIDLGRPLEESGDGDLGDAPEVMDVVFSLRDKSLLALRGEDEKYLFEMLGLIRSFAAERLAKTTTEEFRAELARRHARHFLERAEALHKLMESPMAGALRETDSWGLADALKAAEYAVLHGDLVLAMRMFLATTDMLGRNARFKEQREKGFSIYEALKGLPGGLEAAARDAKLGKHLPRFMASLATACMRTHQFTEGREIAQLAIEIARKAGDAVAEATALNQGGMIAYYQQRVDDGVAMLNQAVEIRRKLSDRKGEAGVLVNLAIIYERLGDFERMRSLLQEALNTFVKIHDKRSEGMAMNNLGVAYERLGDYSRAEEMYKGALRIKLALNDRLGAIQSHGNLGVIFSIRLDLKSAEEQFLKALDFARQLSERRALASVLMRLASVNLAQGRASLASQRAEEAANIAAETGDSSTRTYSLSVLAGARMAAHDETGAQEACRDLMDAASHDGGEILFRAQMRLAHCSKGADRKRLLDALSKELDAQRPGTRAIFNCILAHDEPDARKAEALRREAISMPGEWDELADIVWGAASALKA